MLLQRILRRLVEVRREEAGAVLLMFSYSFLAMTAYNMVQPITRSKFITAHGAENLPYVVLASIVLIALLMQGYSKLGRLVPGRWVIPVTQAVMVGLLVLFWVLYADPATMQSGAEARAVGTTAVQGWLATALYWFGQIYAILLITQFWTLANLIFDPRQAKRLFGFIGAGASLGGFVGGSLPAFFAQTLGSRQLLLVSALVLAGCTLVVITIVSRARGVDLRGLETAGEEKGVGGQEALRMLRGSKHLQIIAVVIGLTSIGAGLVDQQLNMATEAFKGRDETDAMTAVLGQVQVYVSGIGFMIQMFLTTRIQRLLGVGFALMLLPLGFGLMAVIILLNAALWAPMLARVMDKSLRYTVDKTSREILFLPLPDAIKHKAKPFVDVTADRFARALQGFAVLILIAPWGLGLTWQQLSYASLLIMLGWIGMVIVAKRAYTSAFRATLARRDVQAADVRLPVADLAGIEILVEELAHPDERRVLTAIDLLESLDKRNLVTPLLLAHPSSRVRARALTALGSARPPVARHAAAVERLLADPDGEVRAAAVAALTHIRELDVADLVRPWLSSADPRMVITAALALAGTGCEADRSEAERALQRLGGDAGPADAGARRELAVAIRQFGGAHLHHLLVPLISDPDPAVAGEALRSLHAIGEFNVLFVPPLVALLRNRQHKAAARDILVAHGEQVIDTLAYFLRDPEEDIWVRRHLPATLARIPNQQSMNALVAALADQDGFLRFKVLEAIERLRRDRPELTVPREPLEGLAVRDGSRSLTCLSLHYNLVERAQRPANGLLMRALADKTARAVDRIFRLLGLVYPPRDIAAARWVLEHGDSRARARSLEFLDNTLTGALRKRLMPVLEDAPIEEKVRKANIVLRTRPRDEEETLLQLINDDDPVVASLAIEHARAHRVWALEQDIEHVLAHRDPRDWFVFEAASWALAERRMPTERVRQLWLEPLPAAIIAARLGRLQIFASMPVDELFRLAGAGRQSRHQTGQVLGRAGRVPEGLLVLLDGQAEATGGDGHSRQLVAPTTIGFEEFLRNRAAAEVVAATVAVVLFIKDDELRTLLADSTALVEGFFRTLLETGRWPIQHLTPGEHVERPEAADTGAPSLLDTTFVLRRLSVLADMPAEEALHLAALARHLVAEPGDVVSEETDPPAICILLSGEMTLEVPDRATVAPMTVRAADVVGLYETLAGRPVGRQRAVQRTRALRIEREDLFDLMSQHPALSQHLLGALFTALPQTTSAANSSVVTTSATASS